MLTSLDVNPALSAFRLFLQSVQSLSHILLFATPWTAWTGFPVHHQLPSLFKFMSIELVIPSSHLILCCPLFLLPSIFPRIRVFSNVRQIIAYLFKIAVERFSFFFFFCNLFIWPCQVLVAVCKLLVAACGI